MLNTVIDMKKHSLNMLPLLGLISAPMVFNQCNSMNEDEEPYNVLFIAVDDLRPELGCYGADYINSPNIDELAAQSTQFNKAYCNIPVSGASRASIMTGLRPTRERFIHYYTRSDQDAPGATNLNEHFKNHNYKTIANGKVFHEDDDVINGWDEAWNKKGVTSWRDYLGSENLKLDSIGYGSFYENIDVADSLYRDGRIAKKTIRDLRKAKESGKSFFIAAGFIKPHLPFNAPQKYWDMYDASLIEVPRAEFQPGNAPKFAFHNSGELRWYNDIPKEGFLPDSLARKMIHGYYASVSYVDAMIGEVLDELKELGLDKNTVVVLWGDHGWNLREHGIWCKHSNWEATLHAPLLIKVPGEKPSKQNSIVEFVDVYPTLCDVVGLPKPEHLEGESLQAIIKDPNKKSDGIAVSKYHNGVTLINNKYFYTEWITQKDSVYGQMLYDHSVDDVEMNNLAADPANKELVSKLSKILRENRGADF